MKIKSALIISVLTLALLIFSACTPSSQNNNSVDIKNHTVTYDTDGGVLADGVKSTVTAQSYSMLDLPTPVKQGYVFEGWYVGEGINAAQFTATDLVTTDLTLKARWSKAQFTVTFIDYYGNVIARETVNYGETANAPTLPRLEKECLRFDAWDTDISAITADAEVKALYVVDAYTITYVTNSSQSIPTTSYFFGEMPVVPPSPALAGHYFIGWYLDEECTEEYLFDAPLSENLTLYAYFNESIPISTLDDLLAIPEYSTANYFLKNDIDCEGAVITTQIAGFAGTIDGEGHKIHNFVFQPAAAANTGLFNTNGGTIKNINFDNFSYTLTQSNTNSSAGFLVGTNTGTVENIHITNASLSYTAKVDGSGNFSFNYGGIAGTSTGKVDNCSVTGTTLYLEAWTRSSYDRGAYGYLYGSPVVGTNGGEMNACTSDTAVTLYSNAGTYNANYSSNTTDTHLGGIACVNNGTVRDCEAKIAVIASSNNYRTTESLIGGLVYKNNSEIENCSADAKITLNGTFSYISAAGFAEANAGTIKDCFTTAEISNTNSSARLGGFVSYNMGGIYKCYVKGEMNVGAAKSGKGGFAGYNNGSLNSCFSDVSITATDATLFGPFVGNADTASYVTRCYYSIKATFTTNGAPQSFSTTHAEVADPILELSSKDFLIGTLGWEEDVWAFDENGFNYPTLK